MSRSAFELSREDWKRYNPSTGVQRVVKTTDADVEVRRGEAWRLVRQAAGRA